MEEYNNINLKNSWYITLMYIVKYTNILTITIGIVFYSEKKFERFNLLFRMKI